MVLESTILCIDNSEYMRNGDFPPSRLQAQQDAVVLICHCRKRSNVENNIGLITMSSSPQVLTTLTNDVGKILSKLHSVQPGGQLNLITAFRIAHLVLKHRLGKNHRMRIVAFVGSPIEVDRKELDKLAKRLKKEKVNVDIINFGEEEVNTDKLMFFIDSINGREGGGSHLVTVPRGPELTAALFNSPIILSDDGSGNLGMNGNYEFVDANDDPELALALRVSMEEQRQRQEEEARKASTEVETQEVNGGASTSGREETLLQKALEMSLNNEKPAENVSPPDFQSMSEEEQIAYAMQMSLQQAHETNKEEEPMETDEEKKEKEKENEENKKDKENEENKIDKDKDKENENEKEKEKKNENENENENEDK